MEYPKFKVTVSCMTYNHSKYITDAMNGFTMQQTSFPFVCTIVDDASTDGEQEVIRKYVEENFDLSEGSVAYHKETEYAHITYAQHKTNKNCYFAVLYLKENHYSQRKPKMQYLEEWRELCEYEALCEGDDYWIVPDKLEKQVVILDSDSSLSLCAHGFIKHDAENNSNKKIIYGKNSINLKSIIENHSILSTNSMLYRRECLNRLDPNFIKKNLVFDYSLKIMLAIQGGVYIIQEFMSVYRTFLPGSWTTRASTDANFHIKHHLFAIETLNNILLAYGENNVSILKKEIVRRETLIAMLKCDVKKIRNKPWSDIFSEQSLKVKIKFYLKVLFVKVQNRLF